MSSSQPARRVASAAQDTSLSCPCVSRGDSGLWKTDSLLTGAAVHSSAPFSQSTCSACCVQSYPESNQSDFLPAASLPLGSLPSQFVSASGGSPMHKVSSLSQAQRGASCSPSWGPWRSCRCLSVMRKLLQTVPLRHISFDLEKEECFFLTGKKQSSGRRRSRGGGSLKAEVAAGEKTGSSRRGEAPEAQPPAGEATAGHGHPDNPHAGNFESRGLWRLPYLIPFDCLAFTPLCARPVCTCASDAAGATARNRGDESHSASSFASPPTPSSSRVCPSGSPSPSPPHTAPGSREDALPPAPASSSDAGRALQAQSSSSVARSSSASLQGACTSSSDASPASGAASSHGESAPRVCAACGLPDLRDWYPCYYPLNSECVGGRSLSRASARGDARGKDEDEATDNGALGAFVNDVFARGQLRARAGADALPGSGTAEHVQGWRSHVSRGEEDGGGSEPREEEDWKGKIMVTPSWAYAFENFPTVFACRERKKKDKSGAVAWRITLLIECLARPGSFTPRLRSTVQASSFASALRQVTKPRRGGHFLAAAAFAKRFFREQEGALSSPERETQAGEACAPSRCTKQAESPEDDARAHRAGDEAASCAEREKETRGAGTRDACAGGTGVKAGPPRTRREAEAAVLAAAKTAKKEVLLQNFLEWQCDDPSALFPVRLLVFALGPKAPEQDKRPGDAGGTAPAATGNPREPSRNSIGWAQPFRVWSSEPDGFLYSPPAKGRPPSPAAREVGARHPGARGSAQRSPTHGPRPSHAAENRASPATDTEETNHSGVTSGGEQAAVSGEELFVSQRKEREDPAATQEEASTGLGRGEASSAGPLSSPTAAALPADEAGTASCTAASFPCVDRAPGLADSVEGARSSSTPEASIPYAEPSSPSPLSSGAHIEESALSETGRRPDDASPSREGDPPWSSLSEGRPGHLDAVGCVSAAHSELNSATPDARASEGSSDGVDAPVRDPPEDTWGDSVRPAASPPSPPLSLSREEVKKEKPEEKGSNGGVLDVSTLFSAVEAAVAGQDLSWESLQAAVWREKAASQERPNERGSSVGMQNSSPVKTERRVKSDPVGDEQRGRGERENSSERSGVLSSGGQSEERGDAGRSCETVRSAPPREPSAVSASTPLSGASPPSASVSAPSSSFAAPSSPLRFHTSSSAAHACGSPSSSSSSFSSSSSPLRRSASSSSSSGPRADAAEAPSCPEEEGFAAYCRHARSETLLLLAPSLDEPDAALREWCEAPATKAQSRIFLVPPSSAAELAESSVSPPSFSRHGAAPWRNPAHGESASSSGPAPPASSDGRCPCCSEPQADEGGVFSGGWSYGGCPTCFRNWRCVVGTAKPQQSATAAAAPSAACPGRWYIGLRKPFEKRNLLQTFLRKFCGDFLPWNAARSCFLAPLSFLYELGKLGATYDFPIDDRLLHLLQRQLRLLASAAGASSAPQLDVGDAFGAEVLQTRNDWAQWLADELETIDVEAVGSEAWRHRLKGVLRRSPFWGFRRLFVAVPYALRPREAAKRPEAAAADSRLFTTTVTTTGSVCYLSASPDLETGGGRFEALVREAAEGLPALSRARREKAGDCAASAHCWGAAVKNRASRKISLTPGRSGKYFLIDRQDLGLLLSRLSSRMVSRKWIDQALAPGTQRDAQVLQTICGGARDSARAAQRRAGLSEEREEARHARRDRESRCEENAAQSAASVARGDAAASRGSSSHASSSLLRQSLFLADSDEEEKENRCDRKRSAHDRAKRREEKKRRRSRERAPAESDQDRDSPERTVALAHDDVRVMLFTAVGKTEESTKKLEDELEVLLSKVRPPRATWDADGRVSSNGPGTGGLRLVRRPGGAAEWSCVAFLVVPNLPPKLKKKDDRSSEKHRAPASDLWIDFYNPKLLCGLVGCAVLIERRVLDQVEKRQAWPSDGTPAKAELDKLVAKSEASIGAALGSSFLTADMRERNAEGGLFRDYRFYVSGDRDSKEHRLCRLLIELGNGTFETRLKVTDYVVFCDQSEKDIVHAVQKLQQRGEVKVQNTLGDRHTNPVTPKFIYDCILGWAVTCPSRERGHVPFSKSSGRA
ncbi:hypothetical protein BESB_076530 [Besnoitia besnoiti]|uniref:BRCT domain-containing protein n=1 Tax=Besnoitia besnoiti TaxID=94643 RepID=A0A2A9MBY9_BESBE|nr:hypothetical protein BESB_076530 [Besnoitia besnoiti]PFH33436.1 hypothetical protein BESB_076530 [Besnoitia besnoiti]